MERTWVVSDCGKDLGCFLLWKGVGLFLIVERSWGVSYCGKAQRGVVLVSPCAAVTVLAHVNSRVIIAALRMSDSPKEED